MTNTHTFEIVTSPNTINGEVELTDGKVISLKIINGDDLKMEQLNSLLGMLHNAAVITYRYPGFVSAEISVIE